MLCPCVVTGNGSLFGRGWNISLPLLIRPQFYQIRALIYPCHLALTVFQRLSLQTQSYGVLGHMWVQRHLPHVLILLQSGPKLTDLLTSLNSIIWFPSPLLLTTNLFVQQHPPSGPVNILPPSPVNCLALNFCLKKWTEVIKNQLSYFLNVKI